LTKGFQLKLQPFLLKKIKQETEEWLQKLRKKVTVGIVGGSDLVKILEQLGGDDGN
jgi:phosphomannomutase